MDEGEMGRVKTRLSKLEYEVEAMAGKIAGLEINRIVLYLLIGFSFLINLLLAVIVGRVF